MNRLPWIGALRRIADALVDELRLDASTEAEPDEFLTDSGKLAPGSTKSIGGSDPDC